MDRPLAEPARYYASMLAARLNTPGTIDSAPLAIEEVPTPVAGAGELLLRISCCAVCRTDLQICEGDLPAKHLPIIPGHQLVGRVEAVGDGVVGWAIGDRAGAAWLAGACGTCSYCRRANENLCESARFTGWDRDGGFAEYATVDAKFALQIPDAFDDTQAAPLLCGGVIGYRSLKVSGIQRGGRLGLFGFGASAFLALQVARHWGCEVSVFTRSAKEQERALSVGASWAGGYDDDPAYALDAAVTFAPSGDVVVAALRRVDRGATVAINAIHLDRVPEFSYDLLWWERQLRSVANFTRADAQEFLQLAAEIPFVTSIETFGLAEANVALQRLSAGAGNGTAVLRT